MKARGVYVYGVWNADRGGWLLGNTFERNREVHEWRGIPKEMIKRVYIAPPKGKKS